jgi:hypothetical protein
MRGIDPWLDYITPQRPVRAGFSGHAPAELVAAGACPVFRLMATARNRRRERTNIVVRVAPDEGCDPLQVTKPAPNPK